MRQGLIRGAQLFHQHAMPLFPETSAAKRTPAHAPSLALSGLHFVPPRLSALRPPCSCWVACHVFLSMPCAPFMSLGLCMSLPLTTFLNLCGPKEGGKKASDQRKNLYVGGPRGGHASKGLCMHCMKGKIQRESGRKKKITEHTVTSGMKGSQTEWLL